MITPLRQEVVDFLIKFCSGRLKVPLPQSVLVSASHWEGRPLDQVTVDAIGVLCSGGLIVYAAECAEPILESDVMEADLTQIAGSLEPADTGSIPPFNLDVSASPPRDRVASSLLKLIGRG